MESKVFYALTRDTQPGTRVWFPGDLEEFKGCPKCHNTSLCYNSGRWHFDLCRRLDGCSLQCQEIEFCPFCGYELAWVRYYKFQGILKEWTGPQDVISPHKWAIVTMEDGTERTVATNTRAGGTRLITNPPEMPEEGTL